MLNFKHQLKAKNLKSCWFMSLFDILIIFLPQMVACTYLAATIAGVIIWRNYKAKKDEKHS